MPENVTIIGLESLRRRIELIRRVVVDDEVLNRMGQYMTTAILKRTAKGIDADGQTFEPYSPEYAFFRQQQGLPVNKVDLFFTGSMLGSVTHEVIPSENAVEIFVGPGRDPSGVENPAKAFYLNEDRYFFASSDEDVDRMFAIYERYVREKGFGR